MRLLHTGTLKLKEFVGDAVPPYVILSHTWSDDEVTYQNMLDDSCGGKSGFAKIKSCCAQAVADGFEYAWIDTCCIDKSSSAELSEAINSMFNWYRRSEICYAYLSDVTKEVCDANKTLAFSQARWFTRGWTLQELLAPYIVEFFTSDWRKIATKSSDATLIARITGIDRSALMGKPVQAYSIAQRMSWASGRTTSREEDIAYSLLGLFDVNMPLLYGEGSRAFYRLQKKIIKRTDDHSVFAWKDRQSSQIYRGLIASSVDHFAGLGSVRRAQSKFDAAKDALSFNNKGITLKMFLKRESEDTYLASLNCSDDDADKCFCIRLERAMPRKEMFSRVDAGKVIEVRASEITNAKIFELRSICVVDPHQGQVGRDSLRRTIFKQLPAFCLAFAQPPESNITLNKCKATTDYRLVRLKPLNKAAPSSTTSLEDDSYPSTTFSFAHFVPSNTENWSSQNAMTVAAIHFTLGQDYHANFSFGLRLHEGRIWTKFRRVHNSSEPNLIASATGLADGSNEHESPDEASIELPSGEGLVVTFRKRGSCNHAGDVHFHGEFTMLNTLEWAQKQASMVAMDPAVDNKLKRGFNESFESERSVDTTASSPPPPYRRNDWSPFPQRSSRSPRHFGAATPPFRRRRNQHLHPYDRRHSDRESFSRSPTYP